MTPREIVRRTLDYENPERVARSFDGSDFRGAGASVTTHASGWREVGGGRWERTDEWGNTWGRIEATSKGEVARGVLEDLSALDAYEFPDYSRTEDYDGVRRAREEHPDHWLNGSVPGFAFNIARKMRRLDQYLMDLVINRDVLRELHDRIDDMIEDMIRNYAAAGLDGIMFCEDWGTQLATMISPAIWHEEFFPRFARLCGAAHEGGLRVFMHSCGQITDIVPGLMAAGVDALQFDQPDLHGLDTLAAHQERGKITFWCPVDIQQTLQTRDEETIRARAGEMLETLWRGRGGFIAGIYPDNASIGLEPEWQEYACDEFLREGVRCP